MMMIITIDNHHIKMMMFVLYIYLWYVFVFVNQFGKFFYSFAQITHSDTHNDDNLVRYVYVCGKLWLKTKEVLISIK